MTVTDCLGKLYRHGVYLCTSGTGPGIVLCEAHREEGDHHPTENEVWHSVVVFEARVVTLLVSCAAASPAAVACALLTPKGIEVHIHGGLWSRS